MTYAQRSELLRQADDVALSVSALDSVMVALAVARRLDSGFEYPSQLVNSLWTATETGNVGAVHDGLGVIVNRVARYVGDPDEFEDVEDRPQILALAGGVAMAAHDDALDLRERADEAPALLIDIHQHLDSMTEDERDPVPWRPYPAGEEPEPTPLEAVALERQLAVLRLLASCSDVSRIAQARLLAEQGMTVVDDSLTRLVEGGRL